MKLNLKKDLNPIRAAAIAKIDAAAELERGKYVTLGAGQAMVYWEKERQAELVAATPDINPQIVLLVAAEAERTGSTLLDAAAVILSLAHEWRQVAPVIEQKRMAAKDAVAAANTPAAIETATEIQW
jgi:hypothetical protein